jgi:hypothetical protein
MYRRRTPAKQLPLRPQDPSAWMAGARTPAVLASNVLGELRQYAELGGLGPARMVSGRWS